MLYIDLLVRFLTHLDDEKLETPRTWTLQRICKVLHSADLVCTEMLSSSSKLHYEKIIKTMELSGDTTGAQSVRRNIGKFIADINENFLTRLMHFIKTWLNGQQLYYEIRQVIPR